jgi:hypothetical protein
VTELMLEDFRSLPSSELKQALARERANLLNLGRETSRGRDRANGPCNGSVMEKRTRRGGFFRRWYTQRAQAHRNAWTCQAW